MTTKLTIFTISTLGIKKVVKKVDSSYYKINLPEGFLIFFFVGKGRSSSRLSPFQLRITASVRELPLRATWALLLWPTWLTAAVRELPLLFLTERGLKI